MATRRRSSAGLLMYRRRGGRLEVLLVHPGGPFFRNKDEGAWSIPKGEIHNDDESPQAAALREFREEIGVAPSGELLELGSVRQRGGKTVHAWAFEGRHAEGAPARGNTFRMEWPPRSGHQREFPEVDRAAFFDLDTARKKINSAQAALLDRLEAAVT